MEQNKSLNASLLILRLGLGTAVFSMGFMRLHGWFVEYAHTVQHTLGLSAGFMDVSKYIQMICGILIFFGLFTRLAAIVVSVATVVVTVVGFRLVLSEHLNPRADIFGPAGFMLIAIVLMNMGGGSISLDALFSKKRSSVS